MENLYCNTPSIVRWRNLKTQPYLLLSGLPSTLIRHENGAAGKKKWKLQFFVFMLSENILKTELFVNDDVTTVTWFPCSTSFPQKQTQNERWFCFQNFFDVVSTESIWCAVFKFPWREPKLLLMLGTNTPFFRWCTKWTLKIVRYYRPKPKNRCLIPGFYNYYTI